MRAVEIRFEKTAYEEYRELEHRANENRESVEARIFFEVEKVINDLKKALENNRRIEIGRAIPSDKLSSKLAKKLRKDGINIIRSVQLPEGWRMIYTIIGNEIKVIAFVLHLSDHKKYERFLNQ